MASISKDLYVDKLGNEFNRYNNTYHRKIKMKPVDVKFNTYIDSSKEINDKGPKCKIGNIVRISKYKNIFVKGYVPNWSEEEFFITKVKNIVPWAYVINDLKGEKVIEKFYKNKLKKNESKIV